ncbi:alpha-2,8-sialyltransferase 8B [Clupea harengus]|uniref:Alpha-2,8-sialyltransferase 8B n=1 Tax=Clupea harengus TaxID=7950 RepID=A0A6P8EP16_CLUHA|nr:alpha-2,8-sialyltransferase 8B [Clupea harengus]
MSFEFRALLFGIVTMLVIFLIIADISVVEEEIANIGESQKYYLHSSAPKLNRSTVLVPSSAPVVKSKGDNSSLAQFARNGTSASPAEWTFNRTLSNMIRHFDPQQLTIEKVSEVTVNQETC